MRPYSSLRSIFNLILKKVLMVIEENHEIGESAVSAIVRGFAYAER